MPVLITGNFDKDPIKGDWEKLETSFFSPSRACNSKMIDLIRLKFELVRDFMPVLIPCKFDEDWIHSNWEKMETPIFPIQSQWERSRANNSVVKSLTRPKFELIQDFMPVLITWKFDKDLIKGDWENTETPFFPLHVNESFLLPW